MDLMAVLSLPEEVQRNRGFRVEGLKQNPSTSSQDDDDHDVGHEDTTVPRGLIRGGRDG